MSAPPPASSSLSERAVLAALALWSLVPPAILFVSVGGGLDVGTGGRTFLGVDGPDVADQLQYIAWIRDAGENGTFANRFDLADDPYLFFHPMFFLSGVLWKLGVSLPLSFLAWKPVAVLGLFAGFAAYVRRMVEPGWPRVAALLLALFFFTPAAWVLDWGGLGSESLRFETLVVALEMFPGGWVWGLWPLAVSVALMPVYLLCLEGLLEPERRRPGRSTVWYGAGAAAAGLACSWLHPWQGVTLLVLTAGLVVWARLWRRAAALTVPLAATAAPIAYYFALSQTDSSWAEVSSHSGHPHWGLWLALGVAPALALAAVGAPGRTWDLQERALRLWPLAALAVYFILQTAWFYHALAGLTLPLAILGVRGWRHLRIPRAAAVAAVAALTLPGMAFYVQQLREGSAAHFLPADETAALRAVEAGWRDGGVLTSVDLGQAVPAVTGRGTWVGHPTWTPGYGDRTHRAEALLSGRMDAVQARELVRSTGAAFVVAGCGRPDLEALLGPVVAARTRHGCAAVYEVAPRPGR
ncbi:MAG TPA: hypothetical protein VNB64_06415 [Solirubrobacteraceae bacterium]|nr:hypothetical protein [Solirubrobacteraceae bacterium]